MAAINIKLAVDRSCNRVLFADAGSDFVNVLLSFLTLPLSALQCCASGAPSPGCLSNLCDSVERNSRLLKVEACHGMLLTPAHTDEFRWCKSTHIPPGGARLGSSSHSSCKCWLIMARVLHVFEQVGRIGTSTDFVDDKQRFVISDDMRIKPASTSSMQSLPQAFGSDGTVHNFEVVEQLVGWEQVLSMLKASPSSNTVLTDAFLANGTDDMAARATVKVKPSINHKILPSDQDAAGLFSQESKIKVFFDTREKKVMYAECNHEFIDLLLGFLTYPISCVIKTTGPGACHLGRWSDNLYGSVTDLLNAKCFTRCLAPMMLLDPSAMPFIALSNMTCHAALNCGCPKDDILPYCFRRELVESGRYVVDDDLLVHQGSAMSVMKHWCGRNKVMVLEMDITIGKPEALALLRAMLTSKALHKTTLVLTDVFIDRLEEHFSQKKIQIFAKIAKGKTITVEVARADTIATVKSRIKDKVSIPAGCRHELVYGSRYLKESCTVAECNLVRECTVTCEFYKK
ncbi:uncharacterized protein LOC119292977 [Triticum dicoccoides]|uniref:uncharacterized protein LOC119292977 n=1 Tax=Triticum dicoccoides TaxID=85692 RepID=UPI00188F3C89|nr:uncharacterized protein LOC119292977 [Triticum dicoccoides]